VDCRLANGVTEALNDAALVQRLAKGDRSAFDALFARYAGLVKAIALRIVRSDAESDDVVQEVFVQAFRQAQRFNAERGNLAAWITMMARTRALDRLRRVVARREDAEENRPEPSLAPPRVAEGLLVRSALDDLPIAQRVPLELAYWEGLSQTEIADRLGEPLGTIKTRMRAGLARLREALG
jgi:RNA polymerase sigma-70 factor (ECF subfamily)